MNQEFHLSITTVGDNRYLVRTEDVAPGVPLAEEQIIWPVQDWLEQARLLMHDPLMGLLEGQPNPRISIRSAEPTQESAAATQAIPSPSLVTLGQDLYRALFHGMIRDSWLTAQGIAQHRRSPLRLRLGLKDSRLQQLPWEVLHAGDRPLATGTDLTFSRYLPSLRDEGALSPLLLPDLNQPLKVLMVIAAPSDQERLELRREVRHLKNELHPQGNGSNGRDWNPESFTSLEGVNNKNRLLDIQVTILEQPGRAELTQALEQGHYQILHYAGHSNLGDAGGNLYLVSRQTGLTECLSGEDLAGLLVNNGVRLAVLNSCRGAYTAGGDLEAGWQEQNLAQALVNRGVPAVVAMAERIPDDVAITLTQLLYRNLKQGYSIDLSLNRTRQGLISAYGSDQFYWALPILYMHRKFDGNLTSNNPSNVNSLDNLLFPSNPDLSDFDMEESLVSSSDALSVEEPVFEMDDASDLYANARGDEALYWVEESADDPDNDDLNDLVDLLEQENDPDYEEDSAIVANLIQQLSQPPATEEDPIPASKDEVLLPDDHASSGLEIYDQLPKKPKNQLQETGADAYAPEDSGGQGQGSVQSQLGAEAHSKANSDIPSQSDSSGRRRKYSLVWPILGVAGLSLVIGLGVGNAYRLGGKSQSGSGSISGGAAVEVSDGDLLTKATLAFNSNNLLEAQRAVKALLDNGDLQSAQTALAAASPDHLEDPDIRFLQGRFQWQSLKVGDSDYSATDVQRSWRTAVENRSDSIEYHTALGFAYYADGQFDQAMEAWSIAIELDKQQLDDSLVFDAYAGLALTALKSADQEVSFDQQERLLDKAEKFYLLVISKASANFLPNKLGNNWLWLESTIADWRDLEKRISPNF
ncbi:MAG: CHAT domain-containing protein [Leptolyngbyaceae cyanobacterium MO_188.B28]|nr:CHAT domain-containing protein [Leptolyngbyaceae cyanobacterium MO_188.B28]